MTGDKCQMLCNGGRKSHNATFKLFLLHWKNLRSASRNGHSKVTKNFFTVKSKIFTLIPWLFGLSICDTKSFHPQNRVGGKRSSFSPTFVFRPLTPPYVRFRIRRFLWLVYNCQLCANNPDDYCPTSKLGIYQYHTLSSWQFSFSPSSTTSIYTCVAVALATRQFPWGNVSCWQGDSNLHPLMYSSSFCFLLAYPQPLLREVNSLSLAFILDLAFGCTVSWHLPFIT